MTIDRDRPRLFARVFQGDPGLGRLQKLAVSRRRAWFLGIDWLDEVV